MFTAVERRGPHKSMHCKFCKPPGTVNFSDVPTPASLETKTKLHLCHEVADLKVYDVYDELGVVPEEIEACICQLEGYEACPKCAPDKTRKAVKKKVCTCPIGAKPHPNMMSKAVANKKKKKEKMNDDEFWWEKYDREHDARVKEVWGAYLAQRKVDKKLAKIRDRGSLSNSGVMRPQWFQKLSCQQTIYLEYLSTAVRLDLDENITDRTSFVLGGIGFCPRPKKKVLQKCLRYCHYNTIRFLNQLSLLIKEDDPYGERIPLPGISLEKQHLYSWNDRILMTCICQLEFPELLREIMDRLPPLPQKQLPPYIPKPKIRKNPIKHYDSPYDEPVWQDQMDWLEKRKLDRRNEHREHLELKRVKIPSLALVRRPSLIDARPHFLTQIEASQSFHRTRKSTKKKIRMHRKKKATFDSKVDVTAIAGIAASEISTTPKADGDELCVFLRSQEPATESILEVEEIEIEEEAEEEEERKVEPILEPKVKGGEGTSSKSGSIGPLKMPDDMIYALYNASDESDDMPFVTPPKTKSGRTIEEPCPPPKSSPGPPASHYDLARREIGLVNEELCIFDPNEIKSEGDEEKEDIENVMNADIEYQLKQVVRKLRELDLVEEEEEEGEGEGEEEEEPEETGKTPRKKRRKKRVKKGTPKKRETLRKTKASSAGKVKSSEVKKPEESAAEEAEPVDNPEENQSDESEIYVCGQQKEKKKTGKRRGGRRKKKRKLPKKRKMKEETDDPCGNPKKSKRTKNLEETILNDEQKDFDQKTEGKSYNNKDGSDETEEDNSSSDQEEEEEEVKEEKEEEKEVKEEKEEEKAKVFRGKVLPLLRTILKDLSEEGFISAGFPNIHDHPDIKHLMKYLSGEILTRAKKQSLIAETRWQWKVLQKKAKPKPVLSELKISKGKAKMTWNDKKWFTKLIKKKMDIFYYYIAKARADEAKKLYVTLHQEYFGSEAFLNSYYAYMIAARHESIERGL